MDPNGFVANGISAENTLIELLPSIIECVAALTIAFIGVYGINSWRREYKGKRKMELAEEVLALFYQAKDAFSAIRSPLGFSNEGLSRKGEDDEKEEQSRARNQAYVVYERYERWKDTFSRLESLKYRFMAVFGKETVEPFNVARQSLNRVFLSAKHLADLWAKQIPTKNSQEEKHIARVRKEEAIFWEGDDDDDISKKVANAVAQIEAICENASKK